LKLIEPIWTGAKDLCNDNDVDDND
jgi:hypothetical protein